MGPGTVVQLQICAALTGDSVTLLCVDHTWTGFELRGAIEAALPNDKAVDCMTSGGLVIGMQHTLGELGLQDGDVIQTSLKEPEPPPGIYAAEHYYKFGTKYGPSYTTCYTLRVDADRRFELEHCTS